MDCRTSCIINAVIVALFGAALGFVLGAILACLIGAGAAEILDAPIAVATGGMSALVAALIGCGLGAFVGIIIAVVGAVIGAALAGFGYLAWCWSGCEQVAAVSAGVTGVTGQIGQGLTVDVTDLSCEAATAAWQSAEAALDQARAERDAQRDLVGRRRRNMLNARAARNAAVVAIAAVAFWDLPGLAAAIFAAVAATIAAAATEAAFAAAQVRLQELEAKVSALEGALAMAKAIEESACSNSPTDPGRTTRPAAPSVMPPGVMPN